MPFRGGSEIRKEKIEVQLSLSPTRLIRAEEGRKKIRKGCGSKDDFWIGSGQSTRALEKLVNRVYRAGKRGRDKRRECR